MSLQRNNSAVLKCELCKDYRSDAARDRFVTTQCGHIFHETHLRRWMNQNDSVDSNGRCPLDRNPIDVQNLTPVYGYDPSIRELKIKIAVLGDYGVGKTCLIKRFQTGERNLNSKPTYPFDIYTRNIEVDFENVKLEIWEPSGQERYHQSIIPQFLRDCHAIIFCFDSMHFKSLANISKIWMKYVHKYVRSEDYISTLVECKYDLATTCLCEIKSDSCRPISNHEKKTVLELFGNEMFTTSAKNSDQDALEAPFRYIVREILRNENLMEQILGDSVDSDKIQLGDDNEQKGCWERFKAKCC